MNRLASIGETAKALGISISTLRRWERGGKLIPERTMLRFGTELVFAICEAKTVEVVIVNKREDIPFEEDLAKNVLEIITVFSARLYGSRSHKNQKLIDGVRKAVGNADRA